MSNTVDKFEEQSPSVSLFAGKFIVFEGIDGSGKDTVRARLAEQLTKEGVAVQLVNDPGSTVISAQLRNILLEPASEGMHKYTELLLYTAARVQLVYARILPCLEEGVCVLCNRWVFATHAYQGAGNGTDKEIINGLHQTMCGGIMPHAAILIDVPVEVGCARRQALGKLDRIESRFTDPEYFEYYKRVRESYLHQGVENLFDAKATPIVVVDGTLSVNEQVGRVEQVLKKAFS